MGVAGSCPGSQSSPTCPVLTLLYRTELRHIVKGSYIIPFAPVTANSYSDTVRERWYRGRPGFPGNKSSPCAPGCPSYTFCQKCPCVCLVRQALVIKEAWAARKLTAVCGIWKEPGNGLALLKLEDGVVNVLGCCCVTGLAKTWHWREGGSHMPCPAR